MTPESFQLLDNYHKGQLNEEEVSQFHKKMEQDAEFKKEAESYLILMNTLKQYGNRQEIKEILTEAHNEMQTRSICTESGIPTFRDVQEICLDDCNSRIDSLCFYCGHFADYPVAG